MKTLLYLFFIFTLVLGCSTENNGSDNANDDTSSNDDDTDPQDETTLRLWIEEWERYSDSTFYSFEYVYDVEGRLESILRGENSAIIFEYDSYGRLVNKKLDFFDKEIFYNYDSNNNIVSSTGDGWWEFDSEYDYDSHGRLKEKREYFESGSLHRTLLYLYANDEVPIESFTYYPDSEDFENHAIFDWDNKNNPYRAAYTEAYCITKSYFTHNLITSSIENEFPYTIHYNITYNEFDLPIEIKVYYNETHDNTYRYYYQEID